jgi:hypothetical protein
VSSLGSTAAARMAWETADPNPAEAWDDGTNAVDRAAASIEAEASVDASSTTIVASGLRVCESSPARVRGRKSAPLRATRIAVTLNCIVVSLGVSGRA